MDRTENLQQTGVNISGVLNVFQGSESFFEKDEDIEGNLKRIKEKIRELFNLKNVNFLFGSGTSATAISTMKELLNTLDFGDDESLKDEFLRIKKKSGDNLEECLNVIYSAITYYEGFEDEDKKEEDNRLKNLEFYRKLRDIIQKHIFNSINIDFSQPKHTDALLLYKKFYQKLALRNRDNSRIRVFTTNNDLFNETALDALNIHYINGFCGGLRKIFNPAIFNYTFSKRMDTSIDKYEPVENMVYLYKIHGSVNWKQSKGLDNNYFDIEEVIPDKDSGHEAALIYPTPTKQEKSLGSPYLDLFREFQTKLLEPHSVLFVIGYSFSDCHVNDIIYRALATNSTINVVIFGEKPDDNDEERRKRPIFFIDDKRIFIINGKLQESFGNDGETKTTSHIVNHFDYIVKRLIPNLDTFGQEEALLDSFVRKLKESAHSSTGK